MSEWVQCRTCGNLWDACFPGEFYYKCWKCSDWSEEEKKAGRKHQEILRDEMYARMSKINEQKDTNRL